MSLNAETWKDMMKFDETTGSLFICDDLRIDPETKVTDSIFAPSIHLEDWSYPSMGGWRLLLDKPISGEKLILIIHYDKISKLPLFWDIAPHKKTEGNDSNKKKSNELKTWAKHTLGISLPIKNSWGTIDVYHDKHNLTTSLTCIYNEYREFNRKLKKS